MRFALGELKALFFVRDWLAHRTYNPPAGFGPARPRGRRCVVTFDDGEVTEEEVEVTAEPARQTTNESE